MPLDRAPRDSCRVRRRVRPRRKTASGCRREGGPQDSEDVTNLQTARGETARRVSDQGPFAFPVCDEATNAAGGCSHARVPNRERTSAGGGGAHGFQESQRASPSRRAPERPPRGIGRRQSQPSRRRERHRAPVAQIVGREPRCRRERRVPSQKAAETRIRRRRSRRPRRTRGGRSRGGAGRLQTREERGEGVLRFDERLEKEKRRDGPSPATPESPRGERRGPPTEGGRPNSGVSGQACAPTEAHRPLERPARRPPSRRSTADSAGERPPREPCVRDRPRREILVLFVRGTHAADQDLDYPRGSHRRVPHSRARIELVRNRVASVPESDRHTGVEESPTRSRSRRLPATVPAFPRAGRKRIARRRAPHRICSELGGPASWEIGALGSGLARRVRRMIRRVSVGSRVALRLVRFEDTMSSHLGARHGDIGGTLSSTSSSRRARRRARRRRQAGIPDLSRPRGRGSPRLGGGPDGARTEGRGSRTIRRTSRAGVSCRSAPAREHPKRTPHRINVRPADGDSHEGSGARTAGFRERLSPSARNPGLDGDSEVHEARLASCTITFPIQVREGAVRWAAATRCRSLRDRGGRAERQDLLFMLDVRQRPAGEVLHRDELSDAPIRRGEHRQSFRA